MKKTKMLKKNYEFSNVLSNGNYYSGKKIDAFILHNRKKYNYLGLAISVKSGHAYQRNKIKRLLRENYRNFEEKIIPGVSIVFLLKKKINIKDVNYLLIKEDMEIIFKNANVLERD